MAALDMLGHCWEITDREVFWKTRTPQGIILAAFALCVFFQSRITKIPCATVTPPGITGNMMVE
jgi:hypothetical protein